MPSAAPLDYAPRLAPAPGMVLKPWVSRALFCIWLAVLIVDIFVQAVPAFGPFYTGSLMSVPAWWAYRWIGHTHVLVPTFALITIILGWRLVERGWLHRLTRTIALALGIYHVFFLPAEGMYRHLLWGSC